MRYSHAQVRTEDHAERARASASIETAAQGGADAIIDCSGADAIAANGMLRRGDLSGPSLHDPKASDEDSKHAAMDDTYLQQFLAPAHTNLSHLAGPGELDREPTFAGDDQQKPTGGESMGERLVHASAA